MVFCCQYCGKDFLQKHNLTRHINNTHEYDGQIFQCDECEKKFKRKEHLKRHQQSIHEGMVFRCHQCDYKSKRESSLNSHTNSVHKGIKVFKKPRLRSTSQCKNFKQTEQDEKS